MRLILQYISCMIPYCLIGLVICATIRIRHYRQNISRNELCREILILLFTAYCAGLASQRILPRMNIGFGEGEFIFHVYWNNDLASINLIPFKTILSELTGNISRVGAEDVKSVAMLNLLSNILLVVPLGFFLPMLWNKFKSLKNTIRVGIVICIVTEIIQLFVGRSCDIDDVILNTIGILVGFIIYIFFETNIKQRSVIV